MDTVLKDFSLPTLNRAVKANLFEWLAYLGTSPKAESYDGGELKWVLTGISHPFMNHVLHTKLEPEQADARIAATIGHFRSKDSPQLTWWVEPGAQPFDLGERLTTHGLVYSAGAPGMAVDLLALQEGPSPPKNLRIETVSDRATLTHWIQPFFFGFGGPGGFGGRDERNTALELFAGLGFDLPLRSYLGRVDGEPAAISQLFLGAGVAGIYCVATVPEARGQGIGTAMTLAPLREARELGYRIAILQATPMGEGVYRKLGFQKYDPLSNYELVEELN